MSAGAAAGQGCTRAAKVQAFARMQALRDELARRKSNGLYQSAAQQRWEELPDYMKDLLAILAGIDEEKARLDWGAFSDSEKDTLQRAARHLSNDAKKLDGIKGAYL